ncbi:hypothetical protein BGX27_006795 [Mortierella sp. AM989]|nr:hypothetical protein BGX27_006795 [Mortierella sp. AM989]
MAIGVWYMSCLTLITLAYWGLNIFYLVFDRGVAYLHQIQALDLCLRATISPVLFLPAPPCLVNFYRERNKPCDDSSLNGAGGSRYGAGRRNGSYTNEIAGYQGSFITIDDLNGGLPTPYSPSGSHAGRVDEPSSRTGTSLEGDVNFHSKHGIADKKDNRQHDSIGSAYSRIRLFQSRNRGPSMESNKVFNQDFEQDEHDDGQSCPEDLSRLDSFDILRAAATSSGNQIVDKSLSLQKPEPALTTAIQNEIERSWDAGVLANRSLRADSGPETHSRGDFDNTSVEEQELSEKVNKHQGQREIADEAITGSTGWEVGGWGHIRRTSEGNENSLSSPLDLYSANSAQFAQPPDALNAEPKDMPVGLSAVVEVCDNALDDGTRETDSPTQGLTGLQKQLAEHHSALLPVVLAMQDFDDCQSSATYNSRDDDRHGRSSGGDQDSRRHRTRNANLRYVDTSVGDMRPSYSEMSLSQHSEMTTAEKPNNEDKSAGNSPIGHSPNSRYWSSFSASTSAISTHSADDSYSRANNFQVGLPSTKGTEKSPSSFRMKWLGGRKPNEEDQQGQSFPTTTNFTADESKSGKRSSITLGKNDAAQAIKGGKPKEPRRGVFSKVLGDRGRQSQDINEQDRDLKSLDSEGKPMGSAHSNTPATVEALALESTLSNLDANDEEKGLQYYYPDPYYNLTEFKRPDTTSRDQAASQAANVQKNISMSAQRHALSTISSDEEYDPNTASNQTSLAIAHDESSNNGSVKGLSAKTNKSSKKSSKKDAVSLPSLDGAGVDIRNYSAGNSALSSVAGSSQASLGSLLSRSASGSKKLGSKLKSRNSRSKSDAAPSHVGVDVMQVIDFQGFPLKNLQPTSKSIASDPVISKPIQTSLSPPPRQSWARSKSFQGSTPAIEAALLFDDQDNGGISIDTKLANEHGAAVATATSNSDVDPASSGVRSSLSSSLGSPTSATTVSPKLSPTSETLNQDDGRIFASSPPLSPLPTTPSLTSLQSLSRLGSLKPRAPADYRTHSLDRDSEKYVPSSSNGVRTGFSTAAMDLRRANNRHQRSVDNLSSAYYYKRAAELNSNNPTPRIPTSALSRERERERDAMSPGSGSPSASQRTANSGFGYNGAGVADGDEGNGRRVPKIHKSKSSLDYSFPGINIPGVSPSSSSPSKANDGAAASSEDNRTNSLTNSLRMMADDSWTQAMVARARNVTGGGVGNSGGSGAISSPPYPAHLSPSYSQSSQQRQYSGQTRSPSPNASPTIGLGSGTYHGLSNNSNSGNTGASSAEFYSRPSISRSGSE